MNAADRYASRRRVTPGVLLVIVQRASTAAPSIHGPRLVVGLVFSDFLIGKAALLEKMRIVDRVGIVYKLPRCSQILYQAGYVKADLEFSKSGGKHQISKTETLAGRGFSDPTIINIRRDTGMVLWDDDSGIVLALPGLLSQPEHSSS
ncbi:MAG: hypothetical protein AB1700_21435, partial [Bacillota bacterium]